MSDTTLTDSYHDGPFHFLLCTATIANPAIFLRKDHALSANDRVQFDTDDTMPTGISKDTWYYVISTGLTNSEFEVATTKGGSGIQLTVAGSGQLFFAKDRPDSLSVSHRKADSCR